MSAWRGRAVELSWFTSMEHHHDGFLVYRSRSLGNGFTRLSDRLVRGAGAYTYLDKAVRPATTYYYRLGAVELDGTEDIHDPIEFTTPAWELRPALAPGAPNPFSRETTLSFSLPNEQAARLAVYDVAGRLVRSIELAAPAGTIIWDGTNLQGSRVSPGVYFLRLEGGPGTDTKRVVLTR